MNAITIKDITKNYIEYFELLLNIDKTIECQLFSLDKWRHLKDVYEKIHPIRRTLAWNEIVFDIDIQPNQLKYSNEAWELAITLAQDLEKVLDYFNIPFYRYFSGNLLHYHVFLSFDTDTTNLLFDKYLQLANIKETDINTNTTLEFIKMLKSKVFETLLNPIEKRKYKKGKMICTIDKSIVLAKRHMIRCEGAKNPETNLYKTLLFDLPEKRPTNLEIVYPNKIVEWKVEDYFLGYAMYLIRKEFEKMQKIKVKISQLSEGGIVNGKYEWIEKILETPFKDGRKRIIGLILAPYLVNVKKLSEEETFEIIKNWLSKCEGTKIYDSWIKATIRQKLKAKVKPLSSRQAFKTHFIDAGMDVKELEKLTKIFENE